MRNKELKAGDKVWIYAPYMSYSKSGYIVKSVKKSSTLVTVTCEAEYYDGKTYELTMYGHCNSRILSCFDRKYGVDNICYTCDYDLIERKTEQEDYDTKLKDAGRALLKITNFFKE